VSGAIEEDRHLPFSCVDEAIARAGLGSKQVAIVVRQEMQSEAPSMVQQTYAEIVAEARSRDIDTVATFIPRLESGTALHDPTKLEKVRDQERWAREAGFVIPPSSTAFDAVENEESLWLAKWDRHPNVEGHRLIAETLYEPLYAHLSRLAER